MSRYSRQELFAGIGRDGQERIRRALAARLVAEADLVLDGADKFETRYVLNLVRFRTPDAELVVFADGRAIVKGTADPARARTVLARYVGV
ncbi:MAG TPA: hypothetical protein VLL75_11235 [Vicinamibacteria bacterium]|nr:hypothetical protein [Vicinamibacteria bacterium]